MTIFRRVFVPPGAQREPAGEHPGGPPYRLAARFGAADALLLRELARQVIDLVGGESPGGGGDGPPGGAGRGGGMDFEALEQELGAAGDVAAPADPALARLLPDAYHEDPEAAREFRRYTEHDLRAGKVAAAKTVLATLPEKGGRISLSADEAESWLRCLNDMRLALGARLGITEEMGDELARLDTRDRRYAMFAVYDWLTGMQDSLVSEMS